MVLISCPDCGNNVSDAAVSCPGCARPMTQTAAPALPSRDATMERAPAKPTATRRRGLYVLAGLVMAIVFVALGDGKEADQTMAPVSDAMRMRDTETPPDYPRRNANGTSTQPNVLTSPGRAEAWEPLFGYDDGLRVYLDTITEVHDGSRGLVSILFDPAKDRRVNDSVTARASVEHWATDCASHRYRWVGGEYYSAKGALIHAVAHDRQIASLPWLAPASGSEQDLALQMTCKALAHRALTRS